MSVEFNIVSVDFAGFSPVTVNPNRIFWMSNSSNRAEATSFFLMTKAGREEVVAGTEHLDPTTGKWRCSVTSYYNDENDTDVKFIGEFSSKSLCRMALWDARQWSIVDF